MQIGYQRGVKISRALEGKVIVSVLSPLNLPVFPLVGLRDRDEAELVLTD